MALEDERLVATAIQKCGVLRAIATVYKPGLGKRQHLRHHASRLLRSIIDSKLHQHSNTLLRKLSTKLATRIGLVCLKPRLAAWRYQRGQRSLMQNLQSSAAAQPAFADASPQVAEDADDGEFSDVTEDTEETVDLLLTSLKDRDTIVRWSAAKGVGRLTSRLPKEMADEVVASVRGSPRLAPSSI